VVAAEVVVVLAAEVVAAAAVEVVAAAAGWAPRGQAWRRA